MTKRFISLIFHLFLTFFITSSLSFVFASDLEKEQRMRNQVADYVMNGDAIFLHDGTHDFFTIYMQSVTQPAKGTVIMVHGRGFHPNWPELVYPLRIGLPEKGWNTLSIQMPVLRSDKTFYDYLEILHEAHPRLNAAIRYLHQKGEDNIVLLAHSCGVHMAFDWLHNNPSSGITAFIGIGMSSVDRGQPMLQPFALEDIKIPILDIFGEYDYYSVQVNAPRRSMRINQAGHPKSKQRSIGKANHYFTDRDDVLLKEISFWLDSLN